LQGYHPSTFLCDDAAMNINSISILFAGLENPSVSHSPDSPDSLIFYFPKTGPDHAAPPDFSL
jgi:hypothetical protein